MAISSPVGSAVAASSITICWSFHGSRLARAALRGEEADLGDREVALLEKPAHDGADLAGGADDADANPAAELMLFASKIRVRTTRSSKNVLAAKFTVSKPPTRIL